MTLSIAFIGLPFWFVYASGASQAQTGLLMTPWPLMVMFIAPIAGRLSDRHPAGLLGGLGLMFMTAGLLLMLALPADAGRGAAEARRCFIGSTGPGARPTGETVRHAQVLRPLQPVPPGPARGLPREKPGGRSHASAEKVASGKVAGDPRQELRAAEALPQVPVRAGLGDEALHLLLVRG